LLQLLRPKRGFLVGVLAGTAEPGGVHRQRRCFHTAMKTFQNLGDTLATALGRLFIIGLVGLFVYAIIDSIFFRPKREQRRQNARTSLFAESIRRKFEPYIQAGAPNEAPLDHAFHGRVLFWNSGAYYWLTDSLARDPLYRSYVAEKPEELGTVIFVQNVDEIAVGRYKNFETALEVSYNVIVVDGVSKKRRALRFTGSPPKFIYKGPRRFTFPNGAAEAQAKMFAWIATTVRLGAGDTKSD
jgi:hypothetical protein